MTTIIRRIQPIVRLDQLSSPDPLRGEITQNRANGEAAPFDDHSRATDNAALDLQNLDVVLRWMGKIPSRPSINLNPASLMNGQGDAIMKRLGQARPEVRRRLTIEITEHGAGMLTTSSRDVLRSRLHELKAAGVRLSLDDYGSGENGMTRLLWGIWDEVKIDGNLGRQLGKSSSVDDYIAHMRKATAHLGMQLVIEHLEKEDQVQRALEIGADYGQGFALALPTPLNI